MTLATQPREPEPPMTIEELEVVHRVLLNLAIAWGLGTINGGHLLESRRIVEGEMRALGWDD